MDHDFVIITSNKRIGLKQDLRSSRQVFSPKDIQDAFNRGLAGSNLNSNGIHIAGISYSNNIVSVTCMIDSNIIQRGTPYSIVEGSKITNFKL